MKRIVLKLSGESLQDKERSGIDVECLFNIAKQIKSALSRRIQLAIVIGGGNIWRGARGKGLKIDRVISDQMGMMATLINSLALQNALEQVGIPTRVMSAIQVSSVSESYIRRRAIRHLEKGRVLIFAAGIGNPFFSTDTAAALRASEIGADLLLKGTQVDGVYDRDPKKSKKAKKYSTVTLQEAIVKRLGVMDTSALALCQENKLSIRVFNLYKTQNLKKSIQGKSIGTLVKP